MQQHTFMYNPANQHQLFVSPQASQSIENLMKEGWVQANLQQMVNMYHPGYKKHVFVRQGDEQRSFEEKGYFSEPTTIYHPTEGQKYVPYSEAKKMYGKGWYDNPAKFPGNKEAA